MKQKIDRFSLEVGTYAVNCTVLAVEGNIWIVDPGAEASRLADALAARDWTPAAILLTHAHFDHIGAIPELQRRFPGLPVYVHPNDVAAFTHPMNAYPPDYPAIPLPKDIRDCRTLDGVTVIETPGHTPGGVCYYFADEALLLSGDTLFAHSVGRTDFPGGSFATLIASLGKLTKLPPETTVIPGHGPSTTIGEEAANNPFLQ